MPFCSVTLEQLLRYSVAAGWSSCHHTGLASPSFFRTPCTFWVRVPPRVPLLLPALFLAHLTDVPWTMDGQFCGMGGGDLVTPNLYGTKRGTSTPSFGFFPFPPGLGVLPSVSSSHTCHCLLPPTPPSYVHFFKAAGQAPLLNLFLMALLCRYMGLAWALVATTLPGARTRSVPYRCHMACRH